MSAFFSSSFQQQQQQLFLPNNNPSIINANNPFSSILDQVETPSLVTPTTMDDDVTLKRKSQHGPSPNSYKEKKGTKKMKKNTSDEEKKDYVHVRARRGQATDSHSLAERARREKISERMKLLQALVPGCEKVTGKAPMLDEIINYIQSLQYQTEFLSMRLASLSPTYYDFGADLESFMVRPDQDLSNLPSMEACSPTSAVDNYRGLLDDSASSLLLQQQAQMPDVFFPLI